MNDSKQNQVASNPKSVLFFTFCTHRWGGSEELWGGAAIELKKRGHYVYTGHTHSWKRRKLHLRWQELKSLGIEIGKIHVSKVDVLLIRISNRVSLPLAQTLQKFQNWRISRKIRKFKADLVVISQGATYDGLHPIRLPEICQQLGIPYLIICQKSSESEWPMDHSRQAFRNQFLGARRVYFVSEHNRRITSQQLAVTLENAEVVRNPFKVDTEVPLPWPAVAANGRFKLACVARFWPKDKGQDTLLNVLALEHWRTRPLEVHFFGEGPITIGLQEMASFLNLKNVFFHGFSTDVTSIWKENHALVLPSRAEGLALAQVEAMICGRPVIVADAGGASEIIEDGKTGFLANASTIQSLDEAMERAWRCRYDWEAIGLKAAESVSNYVTDEPCRSFANKIEKIIENELN